MDGDIVSTMVGPKGVRNHLLLPHDPRLSQHVRFLVVSLRYSAFSAECSLLRGQPCYPAWSMGC